MFRSRRFIQPAIYGKVSGGGGSAVTWSYKSAAESVPFSGSNAGGVTTFSGVAIGVTSSSDTVVLLIGSDTNAPTSVTITDAGSTVRSMTQLTVSDSPVSWTSMWTMTGFALGSTCTVAISGSPGNAGITAGVISGATTLTAATPTNASFSDPVSIAGVIPTNGIGIPVVNMNALVTPSWTNATSDGAYSRYGSGSQMIYTAHTGTGAGSSINTSFVTGGSQNHAIMGIFAP